MITKDEAHKEVQRLLAEASELIAKAESLMDEHRFSTWFMGSEYCPKDLSEEEIDGDSLPINRDWMMPGDGGEWMSSSDRC